MPPDNFQEFLALFKTGTAPSPTPLLKLLMMMSVLTHTHLHTLGSCVALYLSLTHSLSISHFQRAYSSQEIQPHQTRPRYLIHSFHKRSILTNRIEVASRCLPVSSFLSRANKKSAQHIPSAARQARPCLATQANGPSRAKTPADKKAEKKLRAIIPNASLVSSILAKT